MISVQGCFYHPRPKKGHVEKPRRLRGFPRLISDKSQQDTVLQVPHAAKNGPSPNPKFNDAVFFGPNDSQLVSYGITLNLMLHFPIHQLNLLIHQSRTQVLVAKKNLI